MISKLVNTFFAIYWWIIIVRIFLTWIPTINWYSQPCKFLKDVVDPVLAPFRSIIPSFGGLDISPVVALLFLQLVQIALVQLLRSFGL